MKTLLTPVLILAAISVVLNCGEKEHDTDLINEEESPVETVVDHTDSDTDAVDYSASNSQHSVDVINVTSLPEWMDDPMMIEVLDDGRIMVIGYSTSDSIAILSPDLERIEGFYIEGGQGTVHAVRSEGNSIFALRMTMIQEFDLSTGADMGYAGNYDNGNVWQVDYLPDVFLAVSTLDNTVTLNWMNSAGTLLQSVEDPLDMGSDFPGMMVPTTAAIDSNYNGWVSNGGDGTVYVYRMTGELLTSFTDNGIPEYMRRYKDRVFIGTGYSYWLYDTGFRRVSGGMLPEYCIDIDFTNDWKAVALTRRGEVILMDIPGLDFQLD